jgi:hypothetical protein
VTGSDEFFYIDDLKLEYENSVPTYTLSANVANGRVEFDPPGGTYPQNTQVKVTAVPNSGYTFSIWSGDLSGATNPETITMSGNKNITANTVPSTTPTTYTLRETSPNGTVTFEPAGVPSLTGSGMDFPAGTVVKVTAKPNAGFVFKDWTGDLTGSINPQNITMSGSAAIKTITANTNSSWQTVDVGTVAAAGSAIQNGNIWTIKGSGADIWSGTDAFRYVYMSSTDDCSIEARVADLTNTNDWAKAGVMIRENNDANAPNAMVCLTPLKGISFQWRSTKGSSTSMSNIPVVSAPKWLRVTRSGNTFAAFYWGDSDGLLPDGSKNWKPVGTPQPINMLQSATLGMAVTSHNDGVLCTSTMDNVTAAP